MCDIYTTRTIQKRIRDITRTTNYSPTRVRQNSQMMQQLHNSTQAKWHSMPVSGPSMTNQTLIIEAQSLKTYSLNQQMHAM